MTKDEIKKAIVRIALQKLENPSAKTSELTKNYLEQMNPNWSLGELFVIDTQASRLANDKKFQSMVEIERQEYIDQDTGEVVTITKININKN